MGGGTTQTAEVARPRKLDDGSDYTKAEKRAAREHAAKEFEGKKKVTARQAAPVMAKYLIDTYPPMATDYTTKTALTKACEEWWNKPSLIEDEVAQEARHALVNPTLEYDEEHGDLHFIAKPTKKKTAWSLPKAQANRLCEDTIRLHLTALGEHSAEVESQQGWSPFYITAAYTKAVGSYVGGGTTDHFTIQLAVNYNENHISYHGYPDEKTEGHPLGCSFNKTDREKF
jgi:hypothetical protein